MIAGFQRTHQRRSDCRQARRQGDGAIPAFEFGYRLFESLGCRRAEAPVERAAEPARMPALELGDRRREDGRGANYRGIHGAVKALRVAPQMREQCVLVLVQCGLAPTFKTATSFLAED